MNLNNIIQNIRKQQLECSEYVELLSEDEIKNILMDGNYFYIEKESEILVSCYLKPILENPKIYRVGGFTVLNTRNPSFNIKKVSVILLKNLQGYILKYNISFISTTKRNSLENFYTDIGAKKLSFQECLEQYPLYLKAQLNDSRRPKEYFESATFYVD